MAHSLARWLAGLLAYWLTGQFVRMLGKKEFLKAKKTCCLVNIARGPVVDTDALTEALQEGYIESAA